MPIFETCQKNKWNYRNAERVVINYFLKCHHTKHTFFLLLQDSKVTNVLGSVILLTKIEI